MNQITHNPDEQEFDDAGTDLGTGEEMNFLEMDDAAVMAMQSAPAPKAAATTPASEDGGAKTTAAGDGDEAAGDGTGEAGDGKPEGEGAVDQKEGDKPTADAALDLADDQVDAAAKVAADKAKLEGKTEGDGKDPKDPVADKTGDQGDSNKAPAAVQLSIEQKAAAYDQVLAPFKANGKDFVPASIDELRQLAQMGCNYTKKMQELQPVKRIITMLSNNQLLDEGKLNFLIDLDKGNPEAIQKLLADRQFDPMTADKDKAASYKPGNHQVTDVEVTLQTVLEEVFETDTGKELIADIKDKWDERSKQALFQDPATLRAINEHKANGLYAHIVERMDRLTTLGRIPADTPFLQAYKACGDMLQDEWKAAAAAEAKAKEQQAPPAAAAPVERRVVAPPQKGTNDKAAAAAPTKSGASAPAKEINYLEIPDDEFLKQTGRRL